MMNIVEAYADAEEYLIAKLAELLAQGIDEETAVNTWHAKKLAEIRKLRQLTVQQLQELAPLTITLPESAVVETLTADYNRLLKDTRLQILRQTEDAYRRIVARVVQQSALGVQTRLQTARHALNDFANEGITAFYSADGKRWNITDYTAMATRTTLANAQRESKLQRITDDGRDLMIVRTSPRYCELCSPYKDKVLSISGKSNTYSSLASARKNGLYHANCRCSLSVYIPNVTIIDSKEKIDNNYEDEEQQRYLERQTRKWKRRYNAAITDEDRKKAQDKIKYWRSQTKYNAEENDLAYKPNRISITQVR